MADNSEGHESQKRIIVRPNGPYRVEGGIPLAHKTQVVSEYGEPLTWKKDGDIETEEDPYYLCRCGRSSDMPFCDRSHKQFDFDGAENADLRPTVQRKIKFPSSPHIWIRVDPYLCMNSGFCATRNAGIGQLARRSGDTQVRSLVIAMIERCPSGALTYSFSNDEPDIEPDLPAQISATVEIIDERPILGPLWATGWVPVTLSDGRELERRNRVTLCACGRSQHMPLCDGTHRRKPIYVEKKE